MEIQENPENMVKRLCNINNTIKCSLLIKYILSELKNPVRFSVIQAVFYFIEADYYEKFKEKLIGLSYTKTTQGISCHLFLLVVEYMVLKGELLAKNGMYSLEEPVDIHLDDNTDKVINDTLEKLADLSYEELMNKLARDMPVAICVVGEKIEFDNVFYRFKS